MKCLSKPTVAVKNSEDLVRCMIEAKDPWRQVEDFVSKSISEKQLSEKEGRKALMFCALWLAGSFKSLKDQNQVLQDRILDLQDKIETLKISANTASAISIGHQKTVQENNQLRKENGELVFRLRDAQGAIRSLSASSNRSGVDHTRCLMDIQLLKDQLRKRDTLIAAFNIPEADNEDVFIDNWEDGHAYEFSSVPTHIMAPAILQLKSEDNVMNACSTATKIRESSPVRSGDWAPLTLHINNDSNYKEVDITRTPLTSTNMAKLTRERGFMGISNMRRSTEQSRIGNDTFGPPAPITLHINTGTNCKATGKPEVETLLPSTDLETLSRYFGPNMKIYDSGSLRIGSDTVSPVAPLTLHLNTGRTSETKPDTPLLNRNLTAREVGAIKKGKNTGGHIALLTGRINTKPDDKEIAKTRLLPINEVAALSTKLGPIKVGDDPVETMFRIQNFRKVHSDLKDDGEIFDTVVMSLDQTLKTRIPGSIYKANSLEGLVHAVKAILGWSEAYAHSAFVNCTQRKGESVQAFADRLYTLYGFTVQSPAQPDTDDEVFKWALLKQSQPDICRLVGSSVRASNTYMEVMDCLRRAESIVRAQQSNCEDKMSVLEVSAPQGNLRNLKESSSKDAVKCHGLDHLDHSSETSPLTFTEYRPEENAKSHAELNQHLLELSQDLDIINQLRDQSYSHLSLGHFTYSHKNCEEDS